MAEVVDVDASKYDTRSSGVDDNQRGCYTDGCAPTYMIDGDLNDVGESRWSCEVSLTPATLDCYATFDLGSLFTLSKLSMYFHESSDPERTSRQFAVSTSDDGILFVESFTGENTAGLALGVADDFAFPTGSSGQFVRVTGILETGEWLSISEVEVYVDVSTTTAPAATIPPTIPGTTVAPLVTTPSPTVVGGAACASVTVSNAGDLSGEYSKVDGALSYISSGAITATVAASQAPAVCADASATDCTVQKWQIKFQTGASTLPSYVVYDEAAHPSDIAQVWLRLNCPSEAGCTSSPVDVSVLCSDGSTAGSATPAPVTTSDCVIIEVAGTSGAASDGFYYDDGSQPSDGVAQYVGYDTVNGELTSNGNAVRAKRVDSTCTSTTTVTSAATEACSWRQWLVEPASSATLDYYAFDEASHPVDIAPGALWYTSNLTVVPYDGAVSITCAPATTPALDLEAPFTPAPTVSPADDDVNAPSMSTADDDANDRGLDDDATRAPVAEPEEPVVETANDSGGGSNTGIIAGSVAGGVALLAIAGLVAYKLKKPPPPPPSYDDLVGSA
eukprot:g14182.t1